jgi:hypothetical protein
MMLKSDRIEKSSQSLAKLLLEKKIVLPIWIETEEYEILHILSPGIFNNLVSGDDSSQHTSRGA